MKLPLAVLMLVASGAALGAGLDEMKGIGTVPASDCLENIHIEHLLAAHGIPVAMWGSFVYSLQVPAARAAEATRLLRKDAVKEGYSVDLGETYDNLVTVEGRQRDPCVVVTGTSMAAALQRRRFGGHTFLGRFLRGPEMREAANKYPYIVYLRFTKYRYLATPARYRTYFFAEFKLQKSHQESDGNAEGACEIYANGSRTKEFSYSEGWGGPVR